MRYKHRRITRRPHGRDDNLSVEAVFRKAFLVGLLLGGLIAAQACSDDDSGSWYDNSSNNNSSNRNTNGNGNTNGNSNGNTNGNTTDNDPYFGTPTIDGHVDEAAGDWAHGQLVGTNDTPTDWGVNSLSALYLAHDDHNLYLGVRGFVESNNALVLYLDADYGPQSGGLGSIASATDDSGGLDNALSANITVADPNFKVDWGLGTKGMASADGVMEDNAGWRAMGLNAQDFPWITGRLVSGDGGFEAAIPLTDIFGGQVPQEARIAVFARLVNEDGQYFANQTVPMDDPDQPNLVSQVAVISLSGLPEATCNHDGTCDSGETVQSCPDDCNQGGQCGDPNAFQWDDAVLYFVLVDRFYDSDNHNDPVATVDWPAQYQGGDWAGVEEKLSYLTALGVNTIWLSAPYENRNSPGVAIDPNADQHNYSAYHGYWPSPANIDYSDPDSPDPTPQVESRLGTSDDLHSLIDSAHAEGMYVMFDYVMNHVDIESGLYAAHRDWFYSENEQFILCSPDKWDDPYYGTRCAFTRYLPPFDFSKETPRAWSVADAVWWATEYDIDGYRLDAIKHVPMEWLTDLRSALDAAFPNPVGGRFYLVGETYAFDDQGLIRNFIDPATKLDGQFDFPLRKRICDALFARTMSLNDLFSWWDGNDTFYPQGTIMATWIGNHDIPRAIHFASGQISDCYQGSWVGNSWTPDSYTQPQDRAPYERLALAFGLLMTNRGIPLIYYGDEIGLAGGGDPDNRRMMPWTGLNQDQLWLRDKITAYTRIRRDNQALRRGYRVTVARGSDTFIYKMTGCGPEEDVYVLVNRADADADIPGLPSGDYQDLETNESLAGGTAVSVPARSLRILKPSGN